MANNEWTDEAAAAAARAAQRREAGGASVPAGGVHAPADVSIPGTPEHEGRTPGREEGTGSNAPPRPGVVPGRRGDEPDISPPRGTSAEEVPELHGEPPDHPILYGEDPGDIGQ
ncbi:MAG TPA: hypothetical protein VLC54_17030 [Anaeromyxobacter sp.]|nr:hypothetical protein [Anaeromyxobacter sp.]